MALSSAIDGLHTREIAAYLAAMRGRVRVMLEKAVAVAHLGPDRTFVAAQTAERDQQNLVYTTSRGCSSLSAAR